MNTAQCGIYIADMAATFLEFAELCDAVAATAKKLEKRALIANYLRRVSRGDAGVAAQYLSGAPFAATDRRALNVGSSMLSKALAEVSGVAAGAMGEVYRKHGDLGAAAAELLACRRVSSSSLSMEDMQQRFAAIAVARGATPKLRLLIALLSELQPMEAEFLIKLTSGDMRIGVKESLIEEAIAEAYAVGVSDVRRALMLEGDLSDAVSMAAANRLADAKMKLFHPLGFMLASPVESVAAAIERFREESGEPGGEASLRRVLIEDKYDGIRAQLHCGDAAQPQRVELFSRNRADIGPAFPELRDAFAQITEPVVLDGEILAWNQRDMRALPFSNLQQRLGRKRITATMLEETPVIFLAFDVLYCKGDLLLDQPLEDRRARLEEFVARHSPVTAEGKTRGQSLLFGGGTTYPRLQLAPAVQLRSGEQLDLAYLEARQRGNEGVMLKAASSIYQPGKRGFSWLKMKRELATLDVVVTGVEFGHGRRAGVLSDYTFAVRDGDALKTIGKAYSGLTDQEIVELTGFFKEHTIEDFGHIRSVEPLKVLEVAFNNVTRSNRHGSGFALRFPRILRIRDDKPVSEIDTLERVEQIYQSQPERLKDAPESDLS